MFLPVSLLISFVATVILIFAISKSPMGYEDNEGFHFMNESEKEELKKKIGKAA